MILALATVKGQTSLLFFGYPITISDNNEIPSIRSLIEEFKMDSSLNDRKVSDDGFLPYFEMIQNSTVLLNKFSLISQETEVDFLKEHPAKFNVIDKSPLYCSCYRKSYRLNQEGGLVEDDEGEIFIVLTFGVGEELFSDLAFGILLKGSKFSPYFMHFDSMNYKALKSNFEKRELTVIYSESARLVLESSKDGYLIGRFETKSKELPTDGLSNYYFDISGEFSCKIK